MAKVIIKSLTEEEKNQLGINSWPFWEKEISRFDYTYLQTEHCFILQGEVVVETSDMIYFIKSGDFVTFEKGLICTWDIKEDIKKQYHFE